MTRLTVSAMRSDPAFVADLAVAQHEIAALRQDGGAAKPDTAFCTHEAALVA
ncbi:hypothetical protein [Sphingomonas sp. LR55]|uniref:hypothetical protein n=1 Tax=Sphingomonas sp. LR55 TaxID=3050231 RepID=UPI002FE1B830